MRLRIRCVVALSPNGQDGQDGHHTPHTHTKTAAVGEGVRIDSNVRTVERRRSRRRFIALPSSPQPKFAKLAYMHALMRRSRARAHQP